MRFKGFFGSRKLWGSANLLKVRRLSLSYKILTALMAIRGNGGFTVQSYNEAIQGNPINSFP